MYFKLCGLKYTAETHVFHIFPSLNIDIYVYFDLQMTNEMVLQQQRHLVTLLPVKSKMCFDNERPAYVLKCVN